ncbi:hypothetical protein IAT40_003214 [Kwoniella sp. CBS 6097]
MMPNWATGHVQPDPSYLGGQPPSRSRSGHGIPMHSGVASSPITLSPDTPALPQMPTYGVPQQSHYQTPAAPATPYPCQHPVNRPKSTPLPSGMSAGPSNVIMPSAGATAAGQTSNHLTNASSGPSNAGFAASSNTNSSMPVSGPSSAPTEPIALPGQSSGSSAFNEQLYTFTTNDGKQLTTALDPAFAKKTFQLQNKNGTKRELTATQVLLHIAPSITSTDLEACLRDPNYLQTIGTYVLSSQNQIPQQLRQASTGTSIRSAQAQKQQIGSHIAPSGVSNASLSHSRSISSPLVRPQSLNGGPPSNGQASTSTVAIPAAGSLASSALLGPEAMKIQEQFEQDIAMAGNSIAQGWEQIRAATSSAFANLATTLATPTTPEAEVLVQAQRRLAEEVQKTARSHRTIIRLTDSESKARVDLDEANNRVQAEIDAKTKLQQRIAELEKASHDSTPFLAEAQKEVEGLKQRLDQQTQTSHRAVADMKIAHAKAMADLKLAHETEIKSLRAQLAVSITQAQSACSTSSDPEVVRLRDLLKQRNAKMAELEEEKKAEIKELNQLHDAKVIDLNRSISQLLRAKDLSVERLKKKDDEFKEIKVKHEGEIEVYKTKLAALSTPPTTTGVTSNEFATLKNIMERILSRYQEIHTISDRPPLKDTPAFGPGLIARAEYYSEQMALLVTDLRNKQTTDTGSTNSDSHESLERLFAWAGNLEKLIGRTTWDEPDTRTDVEKSDALLKTMKAVGAYAQARTRASEENAKKVEDLSEQLDKVKAQLAEKEKELDESGNALNANREELKKSNKEVLELKAFTKGLESALDDARAEAATIEARPGLSSEEDEADARHDLEQIQSERDDLVKVVANQKDEIERLVQDVEAEREKVSTAESSLKEGMNAQFAQQAEAHQLEKENGELKAEKNKWKEEAKKAQEKLRLAGKNLPDIKPDVSDVRRIGDSSSNQLPKASQSSAEAQSKSPEKRTLPLSQQSSAPATEPTRKRPAQSPLFLPGDDDDESIRTPSRPSASSQVQVAQTLPRQAVVPGPGLPKKRRRVMSEDGSPEIEIVSLPISRISSAEGPSPAATSVEGVSKTVDKTGSAGPASKAGSSVSRPVSVDWIAKHLHLIVKKAPVKGGEPAFRCKLCFVGFKKAAAAQGRVVTLEDMEPIPSKWTDEEIVAHINLSHQDNVRRLKDKRVREKKEPPSP